MKKLALLILTLLLLQTVKAEDGHQLWLRYQPVNKAKVNGPACLAADQLHTYFQGDEATLVIDPTMADDAYNISGNTITAKNEIGLLYGAYALLRGEQGYSAPYFKAPHPQPLGQPQWHHRARLCRTEHLLEG